MKLVAWFNLQLQAWEDSKEIQSSSLDGRGGDGGSSIQTSAASVLSFDVESAAEATTMLLLVLLPKQDDHHQECSLKHKHNRQRQQQEVSRALDQTAMVRNLLEKSFEISVTKWPIPIPLFATMSIAMTAWRNYGATRVERRRRSLERQLSCVHGDWYLATGFSLHSSLSDDEPRVLA